MFGFFPGPTGEADGHERVDGLHPPSWWRALLDALNEGVIVQAADGRIVACNASAENLLGLSAAQLQAQPALEANWRAIQPDGIPLPPEDSPTQVALRTGRAQTGVLLGRHKPDGTLAWLSVSAQPLFQSNQPDPYAVVVSFTDVTGSRQMESVLKQERDFALQVMNALGQGLTVTGADNRFEYVNPAYARMLGRAPKELLGRTPQDFTAPEDLAVLQEARRRRLQGEHSTYETRLVRPDGALIPVAVTGVPRWREGEVIGAIAVISDLSDRKKAEAAQRASDARLAHILDLASDAVISIDARQHIQVCNAGAERIFGYSAAELIGQPLELLLPERFRVSHAALVEVFAASSETVRQMGAYREVWGRRKDGAEFPIEASIGRVEQAGQVMLSVILRDITERKQVETDIAERERRFRALTTLAPVGIFETDLNRRCTFVNERWLELTGLSEAQSLGEGWLGAVHPGDREHFLARWQAAGDQESALEFRLQAPASRTRWVRCGLTTIRDQAGGVIGYIGALSDITQSKQAELDLSAANKRLSRSVALIEQRHQEIALLNTLGELLQSCHSADEAYEVIRSQAPLLFPDLSGALCLLPTSKNFVEVVAQWGLAPPENPVFAPDDCWALRRGRLHWLDAGEGQGPGCRHAGDPPPPAYLCAPMTAQGDALGLLYLSSQTPDAVLSEDERQLAHTVADSLALSLANLRLRETLRHQSTRDPLTSLFNRRYMEETLERELRRASRQRSTVGLIMLDLDHFKRFNDTFGHAAGDTLLRDLADFLRVHIRGEDVPCRYGGEEFCLILPGASLEIVQERAQLLCDQAASLKVFSGGQLLGAVTLSLGVAVYPLHGATGEAVLRAADAALYRAKQQGRNRVVVA